MFVDAGLGIAPQVLRAVDEGRRLDGDEIQALASVADILALGALADGVRRRHRGATATFGRVQVLDVTQVDAWTAPSPAARELRLVGAQTDVDGLLATIRRARALSRDLVLRGFELSGIWAVGGASGLEAMAQAGLDEVAWVEVVPDAEAAVRAARAAGLGVRVVGVETAPSDRSGWLMSVRALLDAVGGLDVVAPLPRTSDPTIPTTGFDDVRAIALTRLTLDGHVSIQVDWRKDGPKLAQVALTVGADDLDAVSSDDDSSRGPRRLPLEEVRRNIAAAGFVAVERDGRHRRLA